MKTEITRHAARALFASAWADYQEQSPDGQSLSGCEILDVMPQEIPAEAMEAAQRLIADVERLNGESIEASMERAAGLPDRYADRDCDAEYFGHYLAMQAMGTGVGLERVCDRDALALKLPHVEFSYFDLNPETYPDFETAE